MPGDANEPSGGHLRFYKEHGISPVRYRVEDLRSHLERRDSLYRSLGLPPIAFRGARVLEVAPGSGQNSLYVAACGPASLDLVEPNPAGQRDIAAAYADFDLPHTEPTLHSMRLEEFTSNGLFDIVLCENWLGSLPQEIDLIRKLAGLVAPGGVLVLTTVPPAGFFPNVMRKIMALRVIPAGLAFEQNTTALVDIFGPHLATIANMTRSHRDWVHDCLINPHYLNVILPLQTVLNTIGSTFEALHTFPRFGTDWRWFKGLDGKDRMFNATLLEAERQNVHNFIDYRRILPSREAAANIALETACQQVHATATAWQAAFEAGEAKQLSMLTSEIGRLIASIEQELLSVDATTAAAVGELGEVWIDPNFDPRMIRDMKQFCFLFGRETVYASFTCVS